MGVTIWWFVVDPDGEMHRAAASRMQEALDGERPAPHCGRRGHRLRDGPCSTSAATCPGTKADRESAGRAARRARR